MLLHLCDLHVPVQCNVWSGCCLVLFKLCFVVWATRSLIPRNAAAREFLVQISLPLDCPDCRIGYLNGRPITELHAPVSGKYPLKIP